ncbi:HPr(Ser) kinase/phosphatase [Priestia sp. SB1]|uniref:HPr(Ser) kinase/phosphatase n=1 Tax=Priestia sp. SB1 TaxID=3132359 RepID=UPI00317CEBC6
MKVIDLNKLINTFNLEVIAGEKGINNQNITSEEIYRPGLEFTGFYDFLPKDRIHILGKQEMTYLLSLKVSDQQERLNKYFKLNPPCIIITRNLPVTEFFVRAANEHNVTVLKTKEITTNFITALYSFFQKELAIEQAIHGVCVNVFGVGIIIRGESGIGKSEVALSLIERGHRLVSDDLIILRKIGPTALIGTHNGMNHEFLSLRGIGFVNVPRLYGAGSIQSETKINLDICLLPWEKGTYYDAVGLDEKSSNYLGANIPLIELPIRPGRDIASLIEVAAKNWRLQQKGYNALEDFYNRFDEQKSE